jgi:hypothetical protein
MRLTLLSQVLKDASAVIGQRQFIVAKNSQIESPFTQRLEQNLKPQFVRGALVKITHGRFVFLDSSLKEKTVFVIAHIVRDAQRRLDQALTWRIALIQAEHIGNDLRHHMVEAFMDGVVEFGGEVQGSGQWCGLENLDPVGFGFFAKGLGRISIKLVFVFITKSCKSCMVTSTK